jgi:hypothetical protein
LFIFNSIIAAIAVGIHIISQSHSDCKLTRIMTIKITKAVFSKHNRIDRGNLAQVNFYPAIGTITDPTRSAAIAPIVGKRGLMKITIAG